jgi:hypothetical protein
MHSAEQRCDGLTNVVIEKVSTTSEAASVNKPPGFRFPSLREVLQFSPVQPRRSGYEEPF